MKAPFLKDEVPAKLPSLSSPRRRDDISGVLQEPQTIAIYRSDKKRQRQKLLKSSISPAFELIKTAGHFGYMWTDFHQSTDSVSNVSRAFFTLSLGVAMAGKDPGVLMDRILK